MRSRPLARLARLAAVLALLGTAAFRAEADVPKDPDWYRSAVVYGVIPPRFGPHPLKAVTERLDDLRELGVDALWLAPINPTDDPGDVSYAITDYFAVRADFGTPEDLRTLVREAHARGIRILLDFVPNHTSVGHPHYRDAEARGRASPYWGWYDRDARGNVRHYFDWKHLANLDYRNATVRQMMEDAFTYWVREYDVDGFRVDAAWGIRQRAPGFWAELHRHLARVKPGIFLLAEASARDPFYVRSGFDAAYDWTGELGKWAWEKVFDDPSRIGRALDAALSSHATPMYRVARFLNNNDTGERFVTRHGLATTRVAAVLMHALPGIAVVYTGDEVGAEFEPYEEGPPISWVDAHGLRPLYRRLAVLREELPALRRGSYRRVAVPGQPAAFAFLRDAGPAGRALVVLNFGGAARLRLDVSPGGPLPSWDAIAERDVPVRRAGPRSLEVDVGEKEALILVGRPVVSRGGSCTSDGRAGSSRHRS
ncbi:alpha-amylase family glycosyl hydrolase [Anaeromyxobacter oryzae]|uniref:Alpha-amylase n=1 Tax=Anaeromyxobacter oryzae TaxID=2918170 RepID=A0ABM7X1L0_9BACT|nr:alpha-amylase family glycosyl hydrolase [Anaeromyxobacter oryzae]BDG05631.1 alpha-amylase [Anaeromyxobacter oryzae]